MIALLVVLSFWVFVALRTVRIPRLLSVRHQEPASAPEAGAELWGPSDDMQLTRLLRRAADGR